MHRSLVCLALSSLFVAVPASAHVSYTNRDFLANGMFDGADTYTLGGLRIASNFGWADGADLDQGDSHRVRWTKLVLTEATAVTVSVSSETVNGLDLLPAFTVYSGLAPRAAHDGGDHPDFLADFPGYLPTSSFYNGVAAGPWEGALNTVGSFKISNKQSEVGADWATGMLTYVGHAIDGVGVDINGDRVVDYVGDGTADGFVTATFVLDPGSYSIVFGGADYAAQYAEPLGTYLAQRGFNASVMLAPVPEPETWAMLGLGLVGIGLAVRRRARIG